MRLYPRGTVRKVFRSAVFYVVLDPEKRTVKFKVGRLMKQRLATLTGAAIDDEAADVADMSEHSNDDENGDET